jgi:DNA modification methylase
VRLITGDALKVLAKLPDRSVQCVVTSPPYFGLRNYGVKGQLGEERTPEEYTAKLVAIFAEVRRVLHESGVVWLNLGDCYNSSPGQRKATDAVGSKQRTDPGSIGCPSRSVCGLKPKNLLGIPWRVAFALQADGWILRSDCVWSKPNAFPESVKDRPSKAHEYVFLLSKSARYFYDTNAIAEPTAADTVARYHRGLSSDRKYSDGGPGDQTIVRTFARMAEANSSTRNARSVWIITPAKFKGAHFATMPPELAERCIKAGSKPGDVILDPFAGAGTTGLVAKQLGRDFIGIDLNRSYVEMARKRIKAARIP